MKLVHLEAEVGSLYFVIFQVAVGFRLLYGAGLWGKRLQHWTLLHPLLLHNQQNLCLDSNWRGFACP